MRMSKLCRAALFLGAVLLASLAATAQVAYEPGLDLRVYDLGRGVDRTPLPAEGQLPNYRAPLKTIDLSDERPAELGGLTDNFLAVISGRLEAPFTGLYVFRLTSDDGSVLLLNGQMVVNHDGLHGPEPKDAPAYLEKGFYNLELRWFEAGGGAVCKLEWKRPGGEFEPVDLRFLSTPAGVQRQTAPGAKQFVMPPAPQAAGSVGLPPGITIEPARPTAYWPQVAGLAQSADGRPLVLDQATGQLVWVSAGVPPQVLAKDLVDPLGVCTYRDRVYVLCAGHLWEVTEGPKGWTQRDVLRPGRDELFTAGPVAFRDEILFTVGSDPKSCRLSAFNPAGSRAVGRLDKVPSPIGLVVDADGLFIVEAAGAFCRLHAVDTGNRTWRLGPHTVVPTPGKLTRTCQPAAVSGLVLLGDGLNGLLAVAPDDTGGAVWRLCDGFESTPRAVLGQPESSTLLVGCDGNQMTLPPFGLQRLVEGEADTFLATQAKPLANGL
ncbi:MAG: hypothetical protein HZB16_12490, partial [Armatimonadetes bacterium]|nr:hypothetical protein [Armatimonadota bacterium]